MGSGMAGQLLDAGFPLTVFNRNQERARPIVARGATLAASPSEAAAGADVVIAMVADDAASREVWLGDRGALGRIEARGDPDRVQHAVARTGTASSRRRSRRTEAPSSTRPSPAASSRPRPASSCSWSAAHRTRSSARWPVLDAMGRGVVHLGPHGSGAFLKLVNNFLVGVQAVSLAEALALVERSDLSRDTALEVLTGGAPGSPLVKMLSARMTESDYTVHFVLDLMRKDLAYCIAEGAAHGVRLETAIAALSQFDRASETGAGGQDLSAVVEALRASAPSPGGAA